MLYCVNKDLFIIIENNLVNSVSIVLIDESLKLFDGQRINSKKARSLIDNSIFPN